MQYSGHSSNDDIVSDIKYWLTGSATGTVDYATADITRNVNRRYDEVVSLIMRSDGRWEWDDQNFNTLPIGYTDLVDGQQDYEIPADNFLAVSEVAVKRADGTWKVLTSYDRNKGTGQELADLERSSNDGLPEKYDKLGNSVILYPNVDSSKVTLSEGFRVVFQRPPSYFITTDTTKEPGFSVGQRYLSIGASIDYCIANGLSKKQATLEKELARQAEIITSHFASRSKDEQPRMRLQREDYGEAGLAGTLISEDKFNI